MDEDRQALEPLVASQKVWLDADGEDEPAERKHPSLTTANYHQHDVMMGEAEGGKGGHGHAQTENEEQEEETYDDEDDQVQDEHHLLALVLHWSVTELGAVVDCAHFLLCEVSLRVLSAVLDGDFIAVKLVSNRSLAGTITIGTC